jgi:hypothetical protein
MAQFLADINAGDYAAAYDLLLPRALRRGAAKAGRSEGKTQPWIAYP